MEEEMEEGDVGEMNLWHHLSVACPPRPLICNFDFDSEMPTKKSELERSKSFAERKHSKSWSWGSDIESIVDNMERRHAFLSNYDISFSRPHSDGNDGNSARKVKKSVFRNVNRLTKKQRELLRKARGCGFHLRVSAFIPHGSILMESIHVLGFEDL